MNGESDQEARMREIEKRQNRLAERLKEIEERLAKGLALGLTSRQMADNS